MTYSKLLERILYRVCHPVAGQAIFGADEIKDWPNGALEILMREGLLTRAPPTQSVECDGCEQYCFMPVHVLASEGNRRARAFISCDKPVNIGRVTVPLDRLAQCKITGTLLANTLSRLLGFSMATENVAASAGTWNLGQLKGKKRRGEAKFLVGDNGPAFMISGHSVPLKEILTLGENGLSLDGEELLRLVDHPLSPEGSSGYEPSIAKREARKLVTRKRNEAWRRVAKNYWRDHPNASFRDISIHISKQTIAGGKDAETIRKIIR